MFWISQNLNTLCNWNLCCFQSKSLVEVTGYTLEDLLPCVEDLHKLYLNAPQHTQQAVREKYKAPKYVATNEQFVVEFQLK